MQTVDEGGRVGTVTHLGDEVSSIGRQQLSGQGLGAGSPVAVSAVAQQTEHGAHAARASLARVGERYRLAHHVLRHVHQGVAVGEVSRAVN